jgi:ribose 5-phosphate isomerase B
VLALSLRAVGEGVLGEILDAWFATAASTKPDDIANVGHLRELEATPRGR